MEMYIKLYLKHIVKSILQYVEKGVKSGNGNGVTRSSNPYFDKYFKCLIFSGKYTISIVVKRHIIPLKKTYGSN